MHIVTILKFDNFESGGPILTKKALLVSSEYLL